MGLFVGLAVGAGVGDGVGWAVAVCVADGVAVALLDAWLGDDAAGAHAVATMRKMSARTLRIRSHDAPGTG